MACAKQLQAVQGFLRGIRALTIYEVTRERQFAELEKGLRSLAGLTATQAGMLLGSVEEALWSASQVETVARREGHGEGAGGHPQALRGPLGCRPGRGAGGFVRGAGAEGGYVWSLSADRHSSVHLARRPTWTGAGAVGWLRD